MSEPTVDLRAALLNVSIHSAHLPEAPRELVVQLLKHCGEIAREALASPAREPSDAAVRAAARASGFMEEDADFPNLLLARGVAKMLRAAYAIDFAPAPDGMRDISGRIQDLAP